MKVGIEINIQSAIGRYLHSQIVGHFYLKINQNIINTDLFQSKDYCLHKNCSVQKVEALQWNMLPLFGSIILRHMFPSRHVLATCLPHLTARLALPLLFLVL